MNDTYGRWRVWQWGIATNLGSFGQWKLSSEYVVKGFDSKAEAQQWANDQSEETRKEWRNWSIQEVGGNVVVECRYLQIPKSYRLACELARILKTEQS